MVWFLVLVFVWSWIVCWRILDGFCFDGYFVEVEVWMLVDYCFLVGIVWCVVVILENKFWWSKWGSCLIENGVGSVVGIVVRIGVD